MQAREARGDQSELLSSSLALCIIPTTLAQLATMNGNETMTKRRRTLDHPSSGEAVAAAGVPRSDDTVSHLEQRMESMEANLLREIAALKRADEDLLARNKAIESLLSSVQEENDRLKAKVSQLDEDNRKLEAAFRLHVENADWEHDTPVPPSDGYWEDQGYDDEDIQFINEEFFRKSKGQSERLRRGTFGLGSDEEMIEFGDPDSDILIRHDDTMLSHWVEFCLAMKIWSLSAVRGAIEHTIPYSVSISNIELPRNILEILRECTRPRGFGHLEEFHLTRNEFQGSDGIEFALEIIQSQEKLNAFSYEKNPVNDHGCQQIVDAIVSHPNISSCFLDGLCGGGINGQDYLVQLLRKDGMKHVYFANCGVSTNGQSVLSDLIKFHPKLNRLDLGNNDLDDDDAIRLADALRHNRTLEYLSVRGNKITLLGERVLKRVVYDDSSLNALADSNHVCIIDGFLFWSDLYCNGSRAQKIFSLLEKRNKEGTNAHHLEVEMGGEKLKILPLALAAIQIYGEQKERLKWNEDDELVEIKDTAELSITYELLKSWNVLFL